jgi:multicomponent Na+:H+ antiporter subunit B
MPFPTEVFLFLVLIATGFMISRATNLFAAAMLTGVFSLTSACLFTVMDAVDVAFTEAAVGGGFSTVLFLGTLALTNRTEKPQPAKLYPFIIVLLTGGALAIGMLHMKPYGDHSAPIHDHVAAKIKRVEWQAVKRTTAPHAATDKAAKKEKAVGLPNLVTSILGSYRGYDTLGETGVIFTAGAAVMLLLMSRRRREDEADDRRDLPSGNPEPSKSPLSSADTASNEPDVGAGAVEEADDGSNAVADTQDSSETGALLDAAYAKKEDDS